jgi:hypothetical protein
VKAFISSVKSESTGFSLLTFCLNMIWLYKVIDTETWHQQVRQLPTITIVYGVLKERCFACYFMG